MGLPYIIRTRVYDKNHGKEVYVIKRDPNNRKTFVEIKEINHSVRSYDLGSKIAETIYAELLEENPEIKIRMSTFGSNNPLYEPKDLLHLPDRKVITINGPREISDLVKNRYQFITDERDNTEREARIKLPPFRTDLGFYAPLSYFDEEKIASFDIETMNRPHYDTIAAIVFAVNDQKTNNRKIYYINKYGEEGTETKSFTKINTEENFEVVSISGKNNLELTTILDELIHKEDPLMIFGSHIAGYDIRYLRNIKNDFMSIKAPDGRILKSRLIHSGFFPRPETPWIVIDTAAFSQFYFPLTNNKITTVANFLGLKFEKETGGDYEALERMLQKNEGKEYTLQDGAQGLFIGEELYKIIIRAAYLSNNNIETIVNSDKKSWGEKVDHDLRIQNFGVHETKELPRFSGIKIFEIKKRKKSLLKPLEIKAIEQSEFDIGERKRIPFNTKKGLFQGHIYYLTPFTKALDEIIHNDLMARRFKETITENKIDKLVSSQILEARIRSCLYDLIGNGTKNKILRKENDLLFGILHGIKYENNGGVLYKRIKDEMNNLLEILQEKSLINIGNRFLVSQEEIPEINGDMGFYFGSGRVISLKKGSYAMNVDENILVEGKDISGRKGWMTNFERQKTKDYFEKILRSDNVVDTIKELSFELGNDIRSIKENKLLHLFEKEKISRDYTAFDLTVQNQERINAIISARKKHGDRMAYGYQKGKKYSYIDEFIEEIEIDEQRYFERYIGKIDKTLILNGRLANILKTALLSEMSEKQAHDLLCLSLKIPQYCKEQNLDLFKL